MTQSEPGTSALDLALPYYKGQGLKMKQGGTGKFPCGLGDQVLAHFSSTETFCPEQNKENEATQSVCL